MHDTYLRVTYKLYEISCLFAEKDLVDEDEAMNEAVDTPAAASNVSKKGGSKKSAAKKGEALRTYRVRLIACIQISSEYKFC